MDPGSAGAALSAGSIMLSAFGDYRGQRYEAQQDRLRQRAGNVRAMQTDSAYTDELNRTVATIKAIRSSAGASPDSPSTRAVIASETKRSDINRMRQVGAERVQAEQAGNDARFRSRLAKLTLLGGVAKAGGYYLSNA